MDNIAQIIAQPETMAVFVSIILLVALRPLYQAVYSIGIVNRDLDTAIQLLTALGSNQQDEFYNQFKTIHGQIVKIPGLRHAWREFVDTMYFEGATGSNGQKKVYLSHRPSYYFNRESVLGTRLNLSQFLAYPNYLIGIGLTFTFIGLAAALHIAQAGLATGEGQQALKGLLAVASVKFISSIVGIASSLFISVLQRARIRLFQQKLDAFCDLLEDCTKYKSSERLLHDSFNEQRRQTVIFNDMPKTIALGIGEAIGNELSASVSKTFAPLTEEIRSLARAFSESSEAALRKMVDEFLSQLRQSSADEMQGFINSVRTLKESLDTLAVRMESTGKNMDADTKASTARLSETIERFVTAFSPLQNSIAQFNQSLASLESIAGTIEQAGGNISHAADDNKRTATELARTVAEISGKLTPMGELLAGLSQSLDKIHETATHLKTAGETITTAASGFKDSATAMERSEDKLLHKIKIFETLAQNLSSPIAALERVAAQISSASKNMKQDEHSFLYKLKSRWRK